MELLIVRSRIMVLGKSGKGLKTKIMLAYQFLIQLID